MKTRLLLPIILLLAALAGCSTFVAKTHRLDQVHHIYTEEWLVAKMPKADDSPEVPKQKGAFDRSLAAIRNYKAQYGTDSAVAAHLTVLEGLIHLQSGSVGMAGLLEPEVKNAKKALRSGKGVAARDRLIAECYPELVDGWEAIQRMDAGDRTLKSENFEVPADRIAAKLKAIPAGQMAASDVDSGGAYVATSAAMFYLWAKSFHRGAANAEKSAALDKAARRVLEPWMSAAEIKAVRDGTFDDAGMNWGSRERFVAWYAYLAAL